MVPRLLNCPCELRITTEDLPDVFDQQIVALLLQPGGSQLVVRGSIVRPDLSSFMCSPFSTRTFGAMPAVSLAVIRPGYRPSAAPFPGHLTVVVNCASTPGRRGPLGI
jgi:hypothetical protein